MTRVATVMRGEICGDRKTGAAIARCAVTSEATSLWTRRAGVVLRVIEFDVEGFVEARRKVFEWRVAGTDVCVTDRAHRHLRRCELAAMTISTRFVSGEAGRCRVVCAFVT